MELAASPRKAKRQAEVSSRGQMPAKGRGVASTPARNQEGEAYFHFPQISLSTKAQFLSY